jgi:succinate dehydrogenase/fumarate reductase flavoprotein subunit
MVCRLTVTPMVRFISVHLVVIQQTMVKKLVPRACAAADRTGHALLAYLVSKIYKQKLKFFVEWIALDLIRNEAGDVLRCDRN